MLVQVKSQKTVLWDSYPRPKRLKKLSAKARLKADEEIRKSFESFIAPIIRSVMPDAPILKNIFATPPYDNNNLPG